MRESRALKKRRRFAAGCVALAIAMGPMRVDAASGNGFGKVDMQNTCAPAAQSALQGGLAKLHDFEAGPADFQAALRIDPSCSLALWGAAMSVRGNPLAGNLDEAARRAGHDFVAKAAVAGKPSDRERALMDALGVYFRPYPQGHLARTAAYEVAMEGVARRFPDDVDIQAFYALSLLEAVDLNDATYARQRKAGTILEALRARAPDHPGPPHYLIHAYDYPALAQGAVQAAEVYPGLAPASNHAQHMPAHIWSMLGRWDRSIDANHKSGLVADPAAAHSMTSEDTVYDHAFDFIAYARLQLAQDAQVGRDLAAQRSRAPLIVKARYALERDDWTAAATLAVPTDDPFDAAVARFTRSLGAARSGKEKEARAELDKLLRLRKAVVDSQGPYWGGLVDIYAKGAAAWIEQAAGNGDKALADMKAAADLDDGLQKHILLENKLMPMRELLGDLLSLQKRPVEAEAAYRTSLSHAPNRYRSLLGAARAAQAAGQADAARENYGALLRLTDQADTVRPGMAEARASAGG